MNDMSRSAETAEGALSTISGGNVLDIATGSGGFITFLMDSLNDFTEITGIDFNERPLEVARKAHFQENIHLRRMDAARMDFPDGYFDTVSISNSLHHMIDLPGVLQEMIRVCKSGGHIIICEMYRDRQTETQLSHVLLHHWWAAVDTARGITHFETFTRQQVIEISEQLCLHHLEYYDMTNMQSNPKEPELLQELDKIIDAYIQRAQSLEDGTKLSQHGEELRQRIHEIGFHGASSLLVIGKK